MTENEIKDWLGYSHVRRSLKPEIIEAMKDVPVPVQPWDHIAVFRVFLKGCYSVVSTIFVDQ